MQALQREIAQLQKQLTKQQQQLHQASARNKGNDPASAATVATLQSAVTTTSGQLATAVNELAATVLAEGGSITGALVSTSA